MRPTRRIDVTRMRLAASQHLGRAGILALRRDKLGYTDEEMIAAECKSPDELTPEECAMLVEVGRRAWQRWANPNSGKWIPAGPARLFCLETGLDFDDWDPLAEAPVGESDAEA